MSSLKLILQFFSIVITLFLFLLYNPSRTLAEEIIFEDDFSSSDLNHWESNSWDNWFISGGTLVGITSSNQVVPYYIMTGNYNWANYSFEVDVMAEWGIDKAIMFYIGENNNALRFNMRSYYPGGPTEHGNDFILTERTPIGSTNTIRLVRITDFFNFTDQWYNIKAEIINTNEGVIVKGFVDNQLLIQYFDDSNSYMHGKIGLEIWPGYEGERLLFDNLKVKSIENQTPQNYYLSVPNLKQYSSPWGLQIYDSATLWTTDPYISRWGCGLTSAAMVLQYHNHGVNPGTLNSWLNTQPDGYIRNGLVNWLAVSRFTKNNLNKIESDKNLKTLEFSRYKPSVTLEKQAIDNEKPIIYKV